MEMTFTDREFVTIIHGMGLGALFLLAFAGGLAGLYSLRPEWVTVTGIRERVRRLNIGTWVMAIVAWLTVISGTWFVYVWYRATPPADIWPEGVKNAQGLQTYTGPELQATLEKLQEYPRNLLLARPETAEWHTFGMEWKEHVAWLAPIVATAVAFIVWRYGSRLAEYPNIRRALIVLFVLAFTFAAIAGAFGAFITKAAPIY
jgi:hypothetical protein